MNFDIEDALKDFNLHETNIDGSLKNPVKMVSGDDFTILKDIKNAEQLDEIDLENIDLNTVSSGDSIFSALTEDMRAEVLYNEKIKFLYSNFGEKLTKFLEDDNVIEIRLNQDGYLRTEAFGVGVSKTDTRLSVIEGNRILQLIADYNKTTISIERPKISAVLPNGERFEGLTYSPTGFKPVFVIRKKSSKVFTLDDYVKFGVITEEIKEYLIKVMNSHKNILIVGGTSSGKTTFTNGLINVIKDTTDRVIILEDTKELVCEIEDRVELVSSDYCSMKDLLVSCMRLTPTRIFLGELRRGQEALDLLKAWNSGHSGGVCTIHANDAEAGLYKLGQYLEEVSQKPQEGLIAQSVDIVISLVKTKDYRRVLKEIIELKGYDRTEKKFKFEKIFEQYVDEKDVVYE